MTCSCLTAGSFAGRAHDSIPLAVHRCGTSLQCSVTGALPEPPGGPGPGSPCGVALQGSATQSATALYHQSHHLAVRPTPILAGFVLRVGMVGAHPQFSRGLVLLLLCLGCLLLHAATVSVHELSVSALTGLYEPGNLDAGLLVRGFGVFVELCVEMLAVCWYWKEG